LIKNKKPHRGRQKLVSIVMGEPRLVLWGCGVRGVKGVKWGRVLKLTRDEGATFAVSVGDCAAANDGGGILVIVGSGGGGGG